MKKLKFLALCAITAGIATSCQKEEISNEIQPESLDISKAHSIALMDAAVNPTNAVYSTQEYLDGSTVEGVKSGDIFFPLDKLEQGLYDLASSADGETKQYRVNNLISSGNRTIDILGYTGGGNALSGNMRTGLEWAVNNYNRINTTLNFRLTFGTNYQAADMVVYNNNQSGAGGQAEFPSGGRPGKFIQILRDTGRSSNNINEHVIGHEMGHAVGFRHTDYARRKCDRSNEGTAGSIGAINIPGTPTANQWGQSGLDSNSLMISCFDGSEDGEFSATDIVALEFLY